MHDLLTFTDGEYTCEMEVLHWGKHIKQHLYQYLSKDKPLGTTIRVSYVLRVYDEAHCVHFSDAPIISQYCI